MNPFLFVFLGMCGCFQFLACFLFYFSATMGTDNDNLPQEFLLLEFQGSQALHLSLSLSLSSYFFRWCTPSLSVLTLLFWFWWINPTSYKHLYSSFWTTYPSWSFVTAIPKAREDNIVGSCLLQMHPVFLLSFTKYFPLQTWPMTTIWLSAIPYTM